MSYNKIFGREDNLHVGTYVLLNNSSSPSVDNLHSYDFWFLKNLIRLIGDKPFSRGDVAVIKEVSPELQSITIEVLGDYYTEKMPDTIPPIDDLPGLIFLSSKIYLNERSEYVLDHDDNVTILLSYTSSIDGNKAYAAAITMTGNYGKVTGHDEQTNVQFEWVIDTRISR